MVKERGDIVRRNACLLQARPREARARKHVVDMELVANIDAWIQQCEQSEGTTLAVLGSDQILNLLEVKAQ